MVYSTYYTELNLQICNYAQKWRICYKNSKYEFDENFYDHFCPRPQKATKFCHSATYVTFLAKFWGYRHDLVSSFDSNNPLALLINPLKFQVDDPKGKKIPPKKPKLIWAQIG